MVSRLFPAAERYIGGNHYGGDWKARWLRERRVAHEDILRLYLERAAGAGLVSFARAEWAWVQMTNREALDNYLRSLDPAQLEGVIASLEVFEDQFRREHVVPTTIVLLNLLPDLPERQREVLELVYLEGLGPEQVAARLGVKRNAVDQALHNGHRKLAERLGG